ncbi:MAG TPA: hypothetical protein VIV35_12705 [Chitinophagaceae bacterium]
MTTDEKRTEAPSEDIDLLLLLERFISFLDRYRWIFFGAVLAGLVSGYLFYRSIPTTYRSKLVAHSLYLTNPENIQIVNNWDKLLKEKEYKSLADAFNCSENILHGVKQIKAKEIQQVFSPSNPNGFTIDVLVTNNNILDSLQAGIVYGFENNEYVKERLAVKSASLQELITKTTEEIKKLDSTKKIMEGIIGGSGHSSASLIVDGSSINRQLIEMNEKLLGFKESLQFTRAVQVLQSFSKFSKPDGPHLIPWLVIGLFFFLCLAWAFSVFSNVSKKLKKRKQISSN